MPKLLQINVCSAILSTGKIAEDISKVAISHGWEAYTAWGRLAKPSVSHQIKVGTMLGVYFHYVAHKLFDREGLESKHATRKLIRQIEMVKPDIIHLHNLHDHYLNYPILFNYLAQSSVPIVWTQHDCWSFTGGCMYYDLLKCDKWKTSCRNCPEHRAILMDSTERQYALKQQMFSKIKNLSIVSVSGWLKESLQMSFLKNYPIRIIHNGIDTSIFKPIEDNIPSKKYILIGVAAVWDKRKGLDDFIRLRSLLPLEKYEIILVGLKHEQIKRLPDGIVGVPRTTSIKELVRLYSTADVFVNPTYSDNFPTTNVEALACGTPVITYRTGGSPEAIDEKTGAVVDQGDVDALCVKIEEFNKNKFKLHHSVDCRERAVSKFDKDKCFEQYLNLYLNLLNAE